MRRYLVLAVSALCVMFAVESMAQASTPRRAVTLAAVSLDSPIPGIQVDMTQGPYGPYIKRGTNYFYVIYFFNTRTTGTARLTFDAVLPKQVVTKPWTDSKYLSRQKLVGNHLRWTFSKLPASTSTGGQLYGRLVKGASGSVCNRFTITITTGKKTRSGNYSPPCLRIK